MISPLLRCAFPLPKIVAVERCLFKFCTTAFPSSSLLHIDPFRIDGDKLFLPSRNKGRNMKCLCFWLIVGVVIVTSTASTLIVKNFHVDEEEKILEHCAYHTENSLEECLGIPVASHADISCENSTMDISFQASRFAPTGRLAWKVSWGAGMSGGSLAPHKAVVKEALEIWSDLIDDKITLSVRVSASRLGTGVLGAASGSDVRKPMASFVKNVLEAKIQHMLNNKNYKFPSNIVQLMAPPSGTSNRGNQILMYTAQLKALAPSEARSGGSDGQFEFNSNAGLWDTNLRSISFANKAVMLPMVVHELGHLMGFISSVDDVDGGDRNFVPSILDLYRFRGDKPINWASTPRFFQPGRTAQVFSDAIPIGGLHPRPRMPTGQQRGSGEQASHWLSGNGRGYIGVMAATQANLPEGLTVADLRAFSRLGYRVNLFAKPHIYALWKRPVRSGTYYGVTAYLLLTPEVQYMFKGSSGQQCIITARSTSFLTGSASTTDIGSFLVRRHNFFHSFTHSGSTPLPQLDGGRWTVQARNWDRKSGRAGPWSAPLSMTGWNQVATAPDNQGGGSGPGAKFVPCAQLPNKAPAEGAQQPTKPTQPGPAKPQNPLPPPPPPPPPPKPKPKPSPTPQRPPPRPVDPTPHPGDDDENETGGYVEPKFPTNWPRFPTDPRSPRQPPPRRPPPRQPGSRPPPPPPRRPTAPPQPQSPGPGGLGSYYPFKDADADLPLPMSYFTGGSIMYGTLR